MQQISAQIKGAAGLPATSFSYAYAYNIENNFAVLLQQPSTNPLILLLRFLELLRTTFEEMCTFKQELKTIALEKNENEVEQNEFMDGSDAVVIQNKCKSLEPGSQSLTSIQK